MRPINAAFGIPGQSARRSLDGSLGYSCSIGSVARNDDSLYAKSRGIQAMLAKQAVECLPIEVSGLRGFGNIALVAIECASQVRCFEQTEILSFCRAEAEFARLDTSGGFHKHAR